MTSPAVAVPQEFLSFEERKDILVKELELAVKWQRPCVLLVVYSSEFVRADVKAAIENSLIDLGQKAVQLNINDQESHGVVPFLKAFKDPARVVFLVDGLCCDDNESIEAYSTLNLENEFIAERQMRVVFWLTEKEIINLARHAPDFWADRHRVIEFVDSPKAELVAQRALDAAWQGTGEYTDAYDDTEAKISLREALLTDLPQGEEGSSLRGNLLLTLGVLNWRKGNFKTADEQLREALQIAEKTQDHWFEAECYNAIALVRTGEERIDDAIEAYKRAIQLAPEGIFAWNNLGNLCAKIGRNDEAKAAYQKAIQCNSRDPIAWNGLAKIHFQLGTMEDAITCYRRAIEILPTFAQPWNGLGDALRSSGRTDEALNAYHRSIDLNKKYAAPRIQAGALLAKKKQYSEAIDAYQKALDLDSKNSQIWNELGTLYIKVKKQDLAADAFSKAINHDRGNGMAYSNLAFTKMQQGKYKESVSLLLRSIELLNNDKDKAASWNRLAVVYQHLKDNDNARASRQMANNLSKKRPASLHPDPTKTAESDAGASGKVPDVLPEVSTTIHHNGASLSNKNNPIETGFAEPTPEDSRQQNMEPPTKPIEIAVEQESQTAGQPVDLGVTRKSSPVTGREHSERMATALELNAVKAAAINKSTSSDPSGSAASSESANNMNGERPEGINTGEENMDASKWNDKGNASFQSSAFEEAINEYNKAIQLDPSFGASYSNLALTYLTRGQFAEAILLYQKSIELLTSPIDKALSWNGLGNAYRCINDYTAAVAAYQMAAELDPETAGIRERPANADEDQSPKTGPEWNTWGELLLQAGSVDHAIEAFRKAIEMAPASGRAYDNLARAMASMNKYDEAVPFFQKSINLLKDSKDKADVLNRLGNAFRKLNDYDNAIKAYQEAVVLADEGVDLLTRTRFSLLSNCSVNP